jgi:CO dehydrogenase maturation factor
VGFKLAVSGKGGVGKTTIAAMLASLIKREGRRVLAIDADPDANLAAALGMSAEEREAIVPLARRRTLIEERTGARVREYGQIFRLNPEVSDIAEKESARFQGIHLLVLGAVESGGSGCACPENVLLRALLADVVLYKDDAVILDLEAGLEHLGRATAQGVDLMLVVVEPSVQSVETAREVRRMAGEIGLTRLAFVGNKIADAEDQAFIDGALGVFSGGEQSYLGSLPLDGAIRRAHREGAALTDVAGPELLKRFESLWSSIKEHLSSPKSEGA